MKRKIIYRSKICKKFVKDESRANQTPYYDL